MGDLLKTKIHLTCVNADMYGCKLETSIIFRVSSAWSSR